MKIVSSSNNYIDSRKLKMPDIYCWKESKESSHITLSGTYQFFAILYYFGIAIMPTKSDYTGQWKIGCNSIP